MAKEALFSVVYSDDDIVVLNKSSGLLIAADRYDETAPRLDLLAEKEFGRLFAVHRIDKDTSGIIIYARNEEAHKNLSMQFEKREVQKTYYALVYGHPMWDELEEKAPLLPDGDARHRTVVDRRLGKPSVTYFTHVGNVGPFSWIKCEPKTGRTHQIRVHLQANKISIVCDPLYSGNQKPVRLSEIKRKWNGDDKSERPLLSRLALHAYQIEFTHPKTGEKVTFKAPFPKDMEATRNQLEKLFGISPDL